MKYWYVRGIDYFEALEFNPACISPIAFVLLIRENSKISNSTSFTKSPNTVSYSIVHQNPDCIQFGESTFVSLLGPHNLLRALGM